MGIAKTRGSYRSPCGMIPENGIAQILIGARDCYARNRPVDRGDLAALAPFRLKMEDWRFYAGTVHADSIEAVRERDHVPFERWASDGCLNATPGDGLWVHCGRIVQIDRLRKVFLWRSVAS